MNRKIEFKAKDDENGDWLHGYLLKDADIKDRWYIMYNYSDGIIVDPNTICQYWRTVNNIDLYDGDIFSIVNEYKYKKVIRYNDKKSCFCIANIFDLKNENIWDIWQVPDNKWWEEISNQIELIGNIFDNPELLK